MIRVRVVDEPWSPDVAVYVVRDGKGSREDSSRHRGERGDVPEIRTRSPALDRMKERRWEVLVGDCREVLRMLEPESVQTVITSPPYWGLRDFALGADALGLEPTPDLYVERMVEVFREVRRVLRKDGTLWLNLGDSYGANNRGDSPKAAGLTGGGLQTWGGKLKGEAVPHPTKPKDLVGAPWRVAFALQADGWWLRSEIIWSKANPMPESVTDRPTRAHEQVFLLTKNARYFYDADAVREQARYGRSETTFGSGQVGRGWDHDAKEHKRVIPGSGGDRNLRSVWNIPTEPFPEAHFATFPKKLVEPCIKAGSRLDDMVMDPFAGSGTVGVVARGLGRRFIGIELSEEYAEMARRRIGGTKRGVDEDGTPLWEQDSMFS